MAELLLELLSEEIPARMQDRAREDLARIVSELLEGAGVAFDQPVRSFATPRRLTVVATGLPLQQPERVIERRGPRADAPEQARAGFLRGLAGLDYSLEEREDKKAKVLFALVREPGIPVIDVLSKHIGLAVARLPWPKSMRWGSRDSRWVRPLQSILAVFNGEVLRFTLFDIPARNITFGHRFMSPAPFVVRDFADYVIKLRQAKVVLDGAERRAAIARAAEEMAAAEGYVVANDPALLDEVKGLVEWPVPLMGSIDAAFMELPPEVLVGTMRANQKYLTLRTKDGALAPRFVLVANIEASDDGAAIVAGNERVLRARLWDARFFWDQDRKASLESRLPALESMVFHADLGSMLTKVKRIVVLSKWLSDLLHVQQRELAERAALLCKADLSTGMVGEFPDLQGVVGSYYAKAQGEAVAVAQAIRDHYAPRGPDDLCPSEPVSVIVALADKLNTLAGFFAVGIKPTGSKDPFALRRTALGIVRLILENNLTLSLRAILVPALAPFASPQRSREANSEVLGFLAERLKVHLRDRGIRHDVVGAVFSVGVGGEEDDLVRLTRRSVALQAFLDTDDGSNLLTAYRRASSIVGIEEKKDGRRYHDHAVVGALVDPAEVDLFAALERAQAAIDAAVVAEDYAGAMAALAGLRVPVDRFFEAVMVNVTEPDLRVNRLLLLSQIRASLERVADFSVIEDSGRAAA